MNDKSCDTRLRLTYYPPQRSQCLSVILFTGGRGVWQTPTLQTPPWADTPPRQTPLQADTLLGRHPLPSACWDTPPPPPRRPLQQTVSIVLECILVIKTGNKLPKHYVMKISVYQKFSQKNISTR